MYGHQPRYTADNDAGETDLYTQKCQVAACWLLLPQHWGKWDPLQNQHLTATYNYCWIGRSGPMSWPSRSPDLTPMDFVLWGHIKTLIYTSTLDSEEDLIARIVEAVRLNICSKFARNTTYSLEYFSGFTWFPNSVRPNLTIRSTTRTHLWRIVPRQ
jgi:hypothetical protein